jgi:hypothetical protein
MTSLLIRRSRGGADDLRRRGRRPRTRSAVLAAIATLGACLMSAGPAAAGGSAGSGCPPGFDVGAVTLEQTLALPRVQAAFAAGVYGEADVVAAFTSVDRNSNGVVCVQDIATLSHEAGGALAPYMYNVSDDNASAVAGSIPSPLPTG